MEMRFKKLESEKEQDLTERVITDPRLEMCAQTSSTGACPAKIQPQQDSDYRNDPTY